MLWLLLAAVSPHAPEALRDPPRHAIDTGPAIHFFTSKETNRIAFGEELAIRIDGLAPGSEATLRASWQGCSSIARFKADADGRIDLSKTAPLSGNYNGVDPDGMFWSMSCPDRRDRGAQEENNDVRFTLKSGSRQIASARLIRPMIPDGVEAIKIREQGLVGTLFRPRGRGPFPTVLLVGGSEGGIPATQNAAYYASHGYAVLALAYFKEEGLPKQLKRIPLEYFERAIGWMRSRPDLDTKKLAVMGWSRGGELALLLGSIFPQIKSVVAIVPSSVVWQSPSDDPTPQAAWTFHGKDLPFVAGHDFEQHLQTERWRNGAKAIVTTPAFLADMGDKMAMRRAAIPVEKIQGPVLLIGGGSDQLWPSRRLSELAWERLGKRNHPDELHIVPDAGHSLSLPPGFPTSFPYFYDETEGVFVSMGGTARGIARGQRQTIRWIDAFLAQNAK